MFLLGKERSFDIKAVYKYLILKYSDRLIKTVFSLRMYFRKFTKILNLPKSRNTNQLKQLGLVSLNKKLSKSELRTIYPCSDDHLNLKAIKKTDHDLFVGIANLRSLDIISNFASNQIKKIYFFDVNKAQLVYLHQLVKLVRRYPDHLSFISHALRFQKKRHSSHQIQTELIPSSQTDTGHFRLENLGKNTFGGCAPLNFSLEPTSDSFHFIHPLGFLHSKPNYQNLKKNLISAKIFFLHKPLDHKSIYQLLDQNKYHLPLIWLSNLLNPKFITENRSLVLLLSNIQYLSREFSARFLVDARLKYLSNSRLHLPNPHIITYNRILSLTKKNSLIAEIVPFKKWEAESLHPNLEKIRRYHVNNHLPNLEKEKVVLFHCLLSYGVPLQTVAQLLPRCKKKLIILEHNPNSKDFNFSDVPDIKGLKKLLKKHFKTIQTHYVSGIKDRRRNVIIVAS